jgi:hypothetical protein
LRSLDKYGRRRRARKGETLADGERFHFLMQMQDERGHFTPTFSDGSVDHTSPHRPGYRFADVDDADRIAAAEAYEAKRDRLQRRRRPEEEDAAPEWERRQAVARKAAGAVRGKDAAPTLDELRDQADEAYAARSLRLANAWRRP